MNPAELAGHDLNLLVALHVLIRERHVGHAAELLGMSQPGNPATLKNVAMVRWSSDLHFMVVGPNTHYKFTDILKLDPSVASRNIAMNGGSFAASRAHSFAIGKVGSASESVLDVNFAGGDVDGVVGGVGNNKGTSCYYGFINRYVDCVDDSCNHWRREGCNVASGVAHNWNGNDVNRVNFICHHKKPEARKFIVMEFTAGTVNFF